MAQSINSLLRTALQVSKERIAMMDEHDLNILMERLLLAQAYRCDSPRNEIRLNTEVKAADDGCDGWSAKPAINDQWLGDVDTCWQFKAGSAGIPSKIIGEITKQIPRKTLQSGGRFVLVASGSNSGRRGEDDRLEKLRDEASSAGLPTSNIDVFGSERLCAWCNQHPAVAAYWAGRPSGLWTFEDWSNSDEHRDPWQAVANTQSNIEARRTDLDFAMGDILHLHIYGPPGVGKTRFALELCRGAAWSNAVVYIPQASDDPRLYELIDSVVTEPEVQLIVVADEVQLSQLRTLRDSVGRGNGNVRLITVGHSKTPDSTRIPALEVTPLNKELMHGVVNGWHQSMPREHVDFVVSFADGYVRLAKLAADAVARNPTMGVHQLLTSNEIKLFLDGMLGNDSRIALYVLAVLTSVGWTDDKSLEGQAIAAHLGLGWTEVRNSVDDFDRRFGIARRGGRYRYISPTPLGNYLAIEAWSKFPEEMKSLPDVLPTEEARDKYYDRLRSIASNPQAQKFAREELHNFFPLSKFADARAARRWSALSSADPNNAANNFYKAITKTSIEDRLLISDGSRREIVSTLVSLAWNRSSFHDAVWSLALLAEAENEPWANNATNEFVALFQIYLGGTAVPYPDRLAIIDELLEKNNSRLTILAVKALSRAGEDNFTRWENSIPPSELPEVEWQPSNQGEHFDCVKLAINKVTSIADLKSKEIIDDLLSAASYFSMGLLRDETRGDVISFYDCMLKAYPEAREPLRRIIDDIISRDSKYWKSIPASELEQLKLLHNRFEDTSFEARLYQYVGPETWDIEEQPNLEPLATELLSDTNLLAKHWPWLTSGEASNAFLLGEKLAELDSDEKLDVILPSLAAIGVDQRLLCGYIRARRLTRGDDWYDEWMTSHIRAGDKNTSLIFEIVWRCGATYKVANLLNKILMTEAVNPRVVGQLAYGSWSEKLPSKLLESILKTMAETGHRETAVSILARRMKGTVTKDENWYSLALELVTSSELIRSKHMANYYWKMVASNLVNGYSTEVAKAILHEHTDRNTGYWFIKYSSAKDILYACVDRDPIGVWQILVPYLSSQDSYYALSIDFPEGLLDRVPAAEVETWIAEEPENRASAIARLCSKDLSTDETLTSRILGQYADMDSVDSAFFSSLTTGSWWGPSSTHWEELARLLDEVSRRTNLPKLRRWADKSAQSLRRMAESDRLREEEELLR